jgi:hypothetical protein
MEGIAILPSCILLILLYHLLTGKAHKSGLLTGRTSKQATCHQVIAAYSQNKKAAVS